MPNAGPLIDVNQDGAIPLIVVVDDNPSFCKAATRLITSFGFKVATFNSAEEFLQSAPTDVACLILDVQMPGMNGLDLQWHLGNALRSVPIIFVTAGDSDAARKVALDNGAVDFLNKPVEPSTLLAAIKKALGQS